MSKLVTMRHKLTKILSLTREYLLTTCNPCARNALLSLDRWLSLSVSLNIRYLIWSDFLLCLDSSISWATINIPNQLFCCGLFPSNWSHCDHNHFVTNTIYYTRFLITGFSNRAVNLNSFFAFTSRIDFKNHTFHTIIMLDLLVCLFVREDTTRQSAH